MDANLSNYIKSNGESFCLADCGTTHTILRDKIYFSHLILAKAKVNTISGASDIIEGSGRAIILLPNGTQFIIKDAMFSTRSKRNLLSFKDIRQNGYHIETINENDVEYLYITSVVSGRKEVVEKLPSYNSGLYYTFINPIESNMAINKKSMDPSNFLKWHDRLGHPGFIMMRRIIENSQGHLLKNKNVLLAKDFSCVACFQGKFITRPSPMKVATECPTFLDRIQGDICGPITPSSGPFQYFMVLIDASTRWSHVCLLSTRNVAFARLLAQIIRLRAQFPDHTIKKIRLDNAGEFTSQSFNDYCMSIGITIEHPVAHTHTQNGLAESFIKRLKLIARPLLMRTKLPNSAWGHAILHAASLIRIRPTAYHKFSPLQLVNGQEPNISHLRIFGCAVYVPISPTQRNKMGPQRRLGIYVGFDSPSIIKYLEPMTGDMFKARFADCQFDETIFPALGGDKQKSEKERQEILWNALTLSHFDQRTNQCELEVQKIIHLQRVANTLPDAFVDVKTVTRSHIPVANVPCRINLPDEEKRNMLAKESKARLKRGRPVGSKDKNPRKIKEKQVGTSNDITISKEINVINEETSSRDHVMPEINDNEEISINYVISGKRWNRKEIIVDNIFAHAVALDISKENDDHEPRSITECRRRDDWPKWKNAIETELNSLEKRKVFGPIVQTPEDVKPIGFKWVFVRKRNEKNEIVRYKARLVAQGFSQRPGIDYEETYSPVMDAITFRFLISMSILEGLQMNLMDVVTAYLYGSLDNDIYMKIPEGLKMSETYISKPREMYSIKLQRSLYGLKQSGRMWYNRLSEYLLKEGYINNEICPCVFIKRTKTGFSIIAVYVDDLNIIGTHGEIIETMEYLKNEFEMKDLGKTKFCLGLQIEHLSKGVLIHQSLYIEKILKRFNMDKSHPLSSPMIVRTLDVKNDPFRPREEGEEILGPEVPYLSAIGALMYLANCTRPDIAFSVNLLARFSSNPTRRHWTGVKQIFRYLRGTTDMGLFYSKDSKSGLIGYADAGYLSDPHKARSQTGYIFTYGDTAISWRSTKQTLTATSSNHAELLALHEASRECIWLRSLIHHIRESCDLSINKGSPTILYEDNTACIAQIKGGYIKGDRTKHISPKFFFTHELHKNGEIDVCQIRSCDNLADMFTKALPTTTFQKLVYKIGMRKLRDLLIC